MEYVNLDNFIGKDIRLSLKGKNITIQFFDPGKFANIQLATDGKIIIEEGLETNIAKTRLIPIARISNASSIILFLPNQYPKNIYLEIKAKKLEFINANSDSKMSFNLEAQYINIRKSQMTNSAFYTKSNHLLIKQSKIEKLNCSDQDIKMQGTTIKEFRQIGLHPSMLTAISSTFNFMDIYEMPHLYMYTCQMDYIKATRISNLILKDTKCGDIDLKIGDIHLKNCTYQNNTSLTLGKGNVKINTQETKNTVLKSYLLKRKANILVDNQLVYTINTTKNVKIKKIK